jgi:hypothetical protein
MKRSQYVVSCAVLTLLAALAFILPGLWDFTPTPFVHADEVSIKNPAAVADLARLGWIELAAVLGAGGQRASRFFDGLWLLLAAAALLGAYLAIDRSEEQPASEGLLGVLCVAAGVCLFAGNPLVFATTVSGGAAALALALQALAWLLIARAVATAEESGTISLANALLTGVLLGFAFLLESAALIMVPLAFAASIVAVAKSPHVGRDLRLVHPQMLFGGLLLGLLPSLPSLAAGGNLAVLAFLDRTGDATYMGSEVATSFIGVTLLILLLAAVGVCWLWYVHVHRLAEGTFAPAVVATLLAVHAVTAAVVLTVWDERGVFSSRLIVFFDAALLLAVLMRAFSSAVERRSPVLAVAAFVAVACAGLGVAATWATFPR